MLQFKGSTLSHNGSGGIKDFVLGLSMKKIPNDSSKRISPVLLSTDAIGMMLATGTAAMAHPHHQTENMSSPRNET